MNSLPNDTLFQSYWGSYISRTKTPLGFCKYPFLISVEKKRDLLIASSRLHQHRAQQRTVTQNIFSGVPQVPFFVMNIDRKDMVSQAMSYCENASDEVLKMPLKIVFNGEDGIDEGGVKKEFFQLLVSQLFDVRFGMFIPCGESGRYLWMNKDCTFSLSEYKLIGVLFGLAVYNEIILSVSFPSVLYKKMLNLPLKFVDLESVDPELYSGLKSLLEYEPIQDVENVFCLDNEVQWQDSLLGETRRKELIQGGAETPVTGDNRQAYVDAYMRWVLEESISQQFNGFMSGFARVIDPSTMFMFLPQELELLISGYHHLDFHELQTSTSYVGWSSSTGDVECIKWFWEVVNEMDSNQKQRLLKFFSGSSRAPIEGLSKLDFILQRMGPSSNSLPTSHTCFNTLLIPEYDSKFLLKERLLKAIEECEGFGLK